VQREIALRYSSGRCEVVEAANLLVAQAEEHRRSMPSLVATGTSEAQHEVVFVGCQAALTTPKPCSPSSEEKSSEQSFWSCGVKFNRVFLTGFLVSFLQPQLSRATCPSFCTRPYSRVSQAAMRLKRPLPEKRSLMLSTFTFPAPL
jgi:hypothetical protein